MQFYEKKSKISQIETKKIIYVRFVTELVVCFFDAVVLEVLRGFFNDLL